MLTKFRKKKQQSRRALLDLIGVHIDRPSGQTYKITHAELETPRPRRLSVTVGRNY